jgi:quercetin dioxygenase-like cupin family protein
MLWFLETLVTFPVSHGDGDDGISVMESLARRGDSPPYHVHHTEDEAFHVLEGELALLVDGEPKRALAGETHLAPKGVPHTYRVVSERARWLVVTTRGDFERFVRAASRPARAAELPPPSGPPTPGQQRKLAELALSHGIELLGPPLTEEAAEAA